MADLIALGRSGDHEALQRRAETLQRDGGWNALNALELACAWTLAGDIRQADHTYLEADQLDPSLALVPDVWGLWPAPPPPPESDPGQRQAAAELAACFRAWRTPDVQALWREVQPLLQADWRAVLEPPLLDQLLVLGRATANPTDPPLEPPLEDVAVVVVGDAAIAAEPAASHRFWALMARLRPHWALARIRAADLALTRGELERCAHWLEQPPAEARTNPWFHDVSARHAVQIGEVESALQAWEEAIRLAQADPASTALAAVFEQRRRETRRGPGVLQVRSLANRGETAAAMHLLERLLHDDPQWQPLRSLQEQLRHTSPPDQQATSTAVSSRGAAPQDGDGFSKLLNRAAACLEQRGVTLPEGATPPTGLDAAALAEELEAWGRSLSDFEARYALA